jgi:hypothetical protein
MFDVLSDARHLRPGRRRSSLNCCDYAPVGVTPGPAASVSFVVLRGNVNENSRDS